MKLWAALVGDEPSSESRVTPQPTTPSGRAILPPSPTPFGAHVANTQPAEGSERKRPEREDAIPGGEAADESTDGIGASGGASGGAAGAASGTGVGGAVVGSLLHSLLLWVERAAGDQATNDVAGRALREQMCRAWAGMLHGLGRTLLSEPQVLARRDSR